MKDYALLVDSTVHNIDGRPSHPGLLHMVIEAATDAITIYPKDCPSIQVYIEYHNGELQVYLWDESSEGDEPQGVCLIADVEKFKREAVNELR